MIVWALVLLPGMGFGLEVRFRADAVAGGEMLTLADVAEISPLSAAAALNGLVLFPAPGAGEKQCFQTRTLKAYIRDAVSDSRSIEWSGADLVCVRHEGVLVSRDKIRSVIDARLRSALSGLDTEQVCFKLRNPPDSLSLPPGVVEYEVLFSDRDIISSRQVTVIIRVDGRVMENLSLAGRVQAFLPVVVAGRSLGRDTQLQPSHVRMETKNIGDLRNPCLDIREVVGKRLKRPVAIGRVIRRGVLDQPVLVERRQIVTMVLQKGGLRISTRGEATADGRMGELIMVKNLQSEREVPCEVIGEGLARVDF